MNDFVAGIIHTQKVAQWRQEADGTRLAASGQALRPDRWHWLHARRGRLMVAAVTALALLSAVAQH